MRDYEFFNKIFEKIGIKDLDKLTELVGIPHKLELVEFLYRNPDLKFSSVNELREQYLLIRLEEVKEEVKKLKEDLKKKKQYVIEFENGEQLTVDADDPDLKVL